MSALLCHPGDILGGEKVNPCDATPAFDTDSRMFKLDREGQICRCFFYLPLIVLAGLAEIMLTAALDEANVAQPMPDPADLTTNPSVIRFPTAARG
jgi:hypothetical protein